MTAWLLGKSRYIYCIFVLKSTNTNSTSSGFWLCWIFPLFFCNSIFFAPLLLKVIQQLWISLLLESLFFFLQHCSEWHQIFESLPWWPSLQLWPRSLQRKPVQASLLAIGKLLATRAQHSLTKRIRDCCKPGCASVIDGVTAPVRTCDFHDQPFLLDPVAAAAVSWGCDPNGLGEGLACSDQTPWAINDDLAYGFAAVNPPLGKCCACYKLTFTSGPVEGKQMIVQATNTGDIAGNQFDIAVSLLFLPPFGF